MAMNDTLVHAMESSHAALQQQYPHLTDAQQQAKFSKYLNWATSQATGSEVPLSTSVPQKRAGSSTALFGVQPESKRLSIVCYSVVRLFCFG